MSFEDDEYSLMGSDFMRFRFKTDDELVYNEKINIPVCVISLSSIVKKGDIYYPHFKTNKKEFRIEKVIKRSNGKDITIFLIAGFIKKILYNE